MTTTLIKNVVAVESTEGAGAVTWWRLSGDIEKQALEDAWTRNGLPDDLLRIRSTPAAALATACASVAERRLLRRTTDAEGEFAMVRETVVSGKLVYQEECRGHLDDDDNLVTEGDNETLREKIAANYAYQAGVHDGYLVSQWMAGVLIPALDALSLRDKGGIYFIPAARMELFRTIVTAIREVSNHKVFEIAAMRTEEAVAAILDAVEREASALIEKVEDEMINGEPTVRVLRNRIATLDETAQKVSTFEDLLGSGLDKLRARMEGLNAQMAAAIMTIEAKVDAALEAA